MGKMYMASLKTPLFSRFAIIIRGINKRNINNKKTKRRNNLVNFVHAILLLFY